MTHKCLMHGGALDQMFRDPTDYILRVYYKVDDILEYFEKVLSLPSFKELEEGSKVLFDLYTSSSAHYEAIDDVQDGSSMWVQTLHGMLLQSRHQICLLPQRFFMVRSRLL